MPITAEPTVPFVSFGNATLQIVPGQCLQMGMYLINNSAATVNPVPTYRFTNDDEWWLSHRDKRDLDVLNVVVA